ncbi:MAG TPA: ATP-binding protein [Solirubrobacteraceae bacterium]
MLRTGPGLRRRLLLSVLATVAIALIVLIAGFNLVLRGRLRHEADSALFGRSSAELAALRFKGGQVTVPEVHDAAAADAQAWVFAGGVMLEHPPAPGANQRAAQLLAVGGGRTADVAATHSRLYSVPVVVDGTRRGTVVAAVSLRPYERTAQTALIASIVLGFTVLAVVGVAARLLIAGALRPVARMTAQAARWSDADIGRRFELGPPRDELTQLAATLDGLLERIARSLRHEQRFSAELSHELRTPLANVVAEAQFALRHARTPAEHRAGHEQVLASAELMRRTLDTLVAAARVESEPQRGTGDAGAAARSAAEGCTALAAEHGVAVEVAQPPAPVRVGVDADVMERVLAPLIENGCRYASRKVAVTIERSNGVVRFTVADDGPGVVSEEREAIFEPGRRGTANGTNGNGAGLGLALARRLARVAGGDVEAETNGAGGRFTVRLPAA